MRELRFAKAIYPGTEVDAAVKFYEGFGTIECAEEETHWVVRIEAGSYGRERRLAGELSNYALGATLRKRGQQ